MVGALVGHLVVYRLDTYALADVVVVGFFALIPALRRSYSRRCSLLSRSRAAARKSN